MCFRVRECVKLKCHACVMGRYMSCVCVSLFFCLLRCSFSLLLRGTSGNHFMCLFVGITFVTVINAGNPVGARVTRLSYQVAKDGVRGGGRSEGGSIWKWTQY